MSGDGPITERGDPRDRIANQRDAPPVTARHDKATEGRTGAAAVDQAIADAREAFESGEYRGGDVWRVTGYARHRGIAALRVLADAIAEQRRERDEAGAWFENHMVDEDGEPMGLTLAQMLDYVFRWGDGAWGHAGQQTQRAEAAEAERDEWKAEADRRGWPKEAAQEFHRLKHDNPRLARQVADLEAALEVIEGMGDYVYKPHEFATIARAALAARSRDPQEPQT